MQICARYGVITTRNEYFDMLQELIMIKYFIVQQIFIVNDFTKITDFNRMILSKWRFIINRVFPETQRTKFLSHDFRNQLKLKYRHQEFVFIQRLSTNHFKQA